MVYYNKKIIQIKKKPIYLFEIDNFFDLDFYLDIKKIFPKVDPNELSLSNNFGKKSINYSEISDLDGNHKKIFEKLNQVFFSKDFFYFFVKKIYLQNIKSQNNILRKFRYLRYPVPDDNKKSLLDFLFSKISVNYQFSYIKNNGGIVPHVDAQRKYLSLLLYFSPTLIFVIVSEDKILLNKILSINKLKPKCAIVCEKLLNFLINNSLIVVKSKKKAAEIKTV